MQLHTSNVRSIRTWSKVVVRLLEYRNEDNECLRIHFSLPCLVHLQFLCPVLVCSSDSGNERRNASLQGIASISPRRKFVSIFWWFGIWHHLAHTQSLSSNAKCKLCGGEFRKIMPFEAMSNKLGREQVRSRSTCRCKVTVVNHRLGILPFCMWRWPASFYPRSPLSTSPTNLCCLLFCVRLCRWVVPVYVQAKNLA